MSMRGKQRIEYYQVRRGSIEEALSSPITSLIMIRHEFFRRQDDISLEPRRRRSLDHLDDQQFGHPSVLLALVLSRHSFILYTTFSHCLSIPYASSSLLCQTKSPPHDPPPRPDDRSPIHQRPYQWPICWCLACRPPEIS